MDARTLKALKGSIKKWEKIADGSGADWMDENCPLCVRFKAGDGNDECDGCPVRVATGLPGCIGSPYESWMLAHFAAGRRIRGSTIHDDDTAIAAVLELEFLRSLLPEK